MAKYLILNTVFIVLVLLVFRIKPRIPKRVWWITLLIMLILTAIFDSLIVGFDIVGYNLNNISQIYIFKAPIEDFAYTILAVIIIPFIWGSIKK